MVFNATFNTISVISWRSALMVGETGENHLDTGQNNFDNEIQLYIYIYIYIYLIL
jgi:hypothetical protein